MGNTSPTSLVLRHPRYLTTIFLCGPEIVISRGVGVSCQPHPLPQVFTLYPMSFLGSHHCTWDSYFVSPKDQQYHLSRGDHSLTYGPSLFWVSHALGNASLPFAKAEFHLHPTKILVAGSFPVHPRVLNITWVKLPGKEIPGLTLPPTGCQSQKPVTAEYSPGHGKAKHKGTRGNLALVHIWQLCPPTTHTPWLDHAEMNRCLRCMAKCSRSAQPWSTSTSRKFLSCLVSEEHPSPFFEHTMFAPLIIALWLF